MFNKQLSTSWLMFSVFVGGCQLARTAPISVSFSPSSQYVSFLGENGGFCSGVDAEATSGSESCGSGSDIALSQDISSYKVQVAAQFGVFAPSTPTSSAVAIASEMIPIDVTGRTGTGYLELQTDTNYSYPVDGSAQISVTGATLVPGTFAGNYNSVIVFQYGIPFTLSFYATVTADTSDPYSEISIELDNYKVAEHFPAETSEVPTFALAGAGLLLVAFRCCGSLKPERS